MGIGTGLAQQVKDLYRGAGPLGIRVTRPVNTADLRTLDSVEMFTISGGEVLLTSIYGKVTATMENAATLLTLQFTPTADTVTIDMCDASLTVALDAINTIYHITGDVVVDMEPAPAPGSLGVGYASFETYTLILCPGVISLLVEGVLNADGAIRWSLHYVPLQAASRITHIV